jgi:hypothetical protein
MNAVQAPVPSSTSRSRPPARRSISARRRASDQTGRLGTMQDLLWIAVIVGLLALTLAYVRLCQNA